MRALLLVPLMVGTLLGCQEDPQQAGVPGALGDASSTPVPSETYTVLSQSSPRAATPATTARPRAAATPLLYPAPGGDGDSWKDTRGREYRMGLINTPEYDECYGAQATAERKRLVANGFRAQSYTTDDYGRLVSVISLRDGTNLNVWMARNGYADDKYLATFRHENPSLATKLDAAFAAARSAGLGLWSACAGSTSGGSTGGSTTATSSGSCHPDYVTCIPVKGDGSGNGAENDLDCGDIRQKVTLRQIGRDPYRLDLDGNGYGCESYG